MTPFSPIPIVVIEDEADIRKYLAASLENDGFRVFEAKSAHEGRQQILAHRPDAIILDLGLPDMDGQDVILALREWTQTPILVLSARDQEQQKIMALENGADDYLTKPFSGPELVARLKVALRHAKRANTPDMDVIEIDNLRLDIAERHVYVSDEEVRLTPIEYKLLCVLAKNSGKLITYSQLLKDIWGQRSYDNTTHLRIHIQHLREKLGDDALNPKFILTEPGIGYRFKSK